MLPVCMCLWLPFQLSDHMPDFHEIWSGYFITRGCASIMSLYFLMTACWMHGFLIWSDAFSKRSGILKRFMIPVIYFSKSILLLLRIIFGECKTRLLQHNIYKLFDFRFDSGYQWIVKFNVEIDHKITYTCVWRGQQVRRKRRWY
jgi:hypothetical protein